MNTQQLDLLSTTILQEIVQQDTTNALSEGKKVQLAADLRAFVISATIKFIRGQIEHGGNIEDRDLYGELESEIIDSYMYNRANMRKTLYWEKKRGSKPV